MRISCLRVLAAVALFLSANASASVIESFVGQDGFYYVPTENTSLSETPWRATRRDRVFDRELGFGSFTQWLSPSELPLAGSVSIDGIEYIELLLDLDLTEGRSRYMELTTLKVFEGDDDSRPGPALWDMNRLSEVKIVLNNGTFAAKGNPDLIVLLPKHLVRGVEQLMIYSEVNLLNSPYLNSALSRPDPILREDCPDSSRSSSCIAAIAETASLSTQVPTPASLALLLLGLAVLFVQRRRVG